MRNPWIAALRNWYLSCKALREEISDLKVEVRQLKASNGALQAIAKTLRRENASLVEQIEALTEPEIDPPEILGSISGGDALQLIVTTLGLPLNQDILSRIWIWDTDYPMTTIAEQRRFIEADKTNLLQYIPDWRDCDDFAFILTAEEQKLDDWCALPNGLIFGSLYGGHAWSFSICYPSEDDLTPTLYYTEPQNDWEIAAESIEDMVFGGIALP